MNTYLSSVNAGGFYAIVACVLALMTVLCAVFLVKSYKAGIAIGMDPKVLKKTFTASATFTLRPSISILLGVIALSGTLGVPFSWLRLSVIGALQYELNVAEIAVIPLLLVSLLCIFVPAAISQTSLLMIPCGALALAIGFLLFKKGKL